VRQIYGLSVSVPFFEKSCLTCHQKQGYQEGEVRVIKHQAVIDALTGIPNRRSFSERILAEFTISRKMDAELSVIMCDIDNFKNIMTGMVMSSLSAILLFGR
jgi:PleD family two-component response regulator